MIDLSEVGAFAFEPTADGVPVQFGLYLPGIGDGFQVMVLVIPQADRFTATVKPQGVSPLANRGSERAVVGGGDHRSAARHEFRQA